MAQEREAFHGRTKQIIQVEVHSARRRRSKMAQGKWEMTDEERREVNYTERICNERASERVFDEW